MRSVPRNRRLYNVACSVCWDTADRMMALRKEEIQQWSEKEEEEEEERRRKRRRGGGRGGEEEEEEEEEDMGKGKSSIVKGKMQEFA